jgi:uncharacterized surface protein with fasciclin (FAS1) repeats
VSELGQPPIGDTQIIPVMARIDPRFERRGQWNDDRTGRFVIVGLVTALAFLLVAAAVWWAGGNVGPSDATATNASTIPPPTQPPAEVANSAPASTLPLSSYPLPAQGVAMTDAAQTAPPPPVAPAPPPVTEGVTTAPTVAATTTIAVSTTIAPTTTVSRPTTTVSRPTTTVSRPTTTVAPTTVATTVAATAAPTTTTAATTTPTTTSAPATTVPGPVVTSPAAADATLLDVVRDTPDLSRVRELVDMSGFAPELDAARALTFLAPSNAAVQAWSSTPAGQAVLADPDAVYDLLLRHLVPAEMNEATIFTRTSLDTVSGAQLIVSQQSHTIDGADLLVADVNAANGHLHVVSDVLTGT